MAKRAKIGLIYSYEKNWVAGSYYILNLIHALNLQRDEDKPELVILSHTPEEFDTIIKTGYPYLKFHQLFEKDFWVSYKLSDRIFNKISRIIIGRNIIHRTQTYKRLDEQIDLLFPASLHIYFSGVQNKLFWIPDFQEHFLPRFFSEQDIQNRKADQKTLADKAFPIVFSSKNALEHFKMLYQGSRSRTFVLPFAVSHPAYRHISPEALYLKFNIDQPYFFCTNQFWAHKNHIVVLKALKLLIEQNVKNVLVVFSGKEYDYRNPHFFTELKKFVTENGLSGYVRFLGFIDRDEQLQLMNNAISVIQPSLFEGWSTVVEDAKAMSQHIIVSELPVHKEQLTANAAFFDPENEFQLAAILKKYSAELPERLAASYSQNVERFGKEFIEIYKKLKL